MQLGEELNKSKAAYVQDLEARNNAMAALQNRLQELQNKVNQGGQYEAKSEKVHRIVGGVMGLIGSIEGECERSARFGLHP